MEELEGMERGARGKWRNACKQSFLIQKTHLGFTHWQGQSSCSISRYITKSFAAIRYASMKRELITDSGRGADDCENKGWTLFAWQQKNGTCSIQISSQQNTGWLCGGFWLISILFINRSVKAAFSASISAGMRTRFLHMFNRFLKSKL